MQAQAYQNAEDLQRVQAALMRWVQQAGHCNYWHKGDIGHRLFNGGYGQPPQDMLHYWTNDAGQVSAFVILYPQGESFDLQLAPALRLSDIHAARFDWCEQAALRFARRIDKRMNELALEAFDCDRRYIAFLEARGYVHQRHFLTMTRHDYDRIPAARLPAGFRFHDAAAPDARQLADVHNHSFTNKWTAESYHRVFESPHMEREIVAVAPDGRFAAFVNVWVDEINRSLLFEPVGAHIDFRRRGIGKALMVYALKRMQAEHGLACAYVCHEPPQKNAAAAALYASLGFKKLYDIHEYAKPMPSK